MKQAIIKTTAAILAVFAGIMPGIAAAQDPRVPPGFELPEFDTGDGSLDLTFEDRMFGLLEVTHDIDAIRQRQMLELSEASGILPGDVVASGMFSQDAFNADQDAWLNAYMKNENNAAHSLTQPEYIGDIGMKPDNFGQISIERSIPDAVMLFELSAEKYSKEQAQFDAANTFENVVAQNRSNTVTLMEMAGMGNFASDFKKIQQASAYKEYGFSSELTDKVGSYRESIATTSGNVFATLKETGFFDMSVMTPELRNILSRGSVNMQQLLMAIDQNTRMGNDRPDMDEALLLYKEGGAESLFDTGWFADKDGNLYTVETLKEMMPETTRQEITNNIMPESDFKRIMRAMSDTSGVTYRNHLRNMENDPDYKASFYAAATAYGISNGGVSPLITDPDYVSWVKDTGNNKFIDPGSLELLTKVANMSGADPDMAAGLLLSTSLNTTPAGSKFVDAGGMGVLEITDGIGLSGKFYTYDDWSKMHGGRGWFANTFYNASRYAKEMMETISLETAITMTQNGNFTAVKTFHLNSQYSYELGDTIVINDPNDPNLYRPGYTLVCTKP